MEYRFDLKYTPTSGVISTHRYVRPNYDDDLSIVNEMEDDEWYRKRKLEGKLTFLREDYKWIMGCAFDGTFMLTVQGSTDGGATWLPYIEGTFSRADLEIDEDNQNVVLNGLNEGGEYNVIENGKDEDYDLMKIIPDADAKEVQGEVHPALAMVDYNTTKIEHSDIFCDTATTAAGYKDGAESGYSEYARIPQNDGKWGNVSVVLEAKIEGDVYDNTSNFFAGNVAYNPNYPASEYGTWPHIIYQGSLYNKDRWHIDFDINMDQSYALRYNAVLKDSQGNTIFTSLPYFIGYTETGYYTPLELTIYTFPTQRNHVKVLFHYIRPTLLTQSGGNADNVLGTGDYYKRMAAFNNADGGLIIAASANTVEQPNGHRLVPGTGEQGTVPQYFAPPDETEHWIPLCEYEWQYASMWYTIKPSVANGLLDPTKVGSFRWARCWTLGTCLDRLLRKITNNKVTFDQSEAGSEFLYSTVNPLTHGEPFEYLFTQKSNVMRPSLGGESAARCIVRLEWFLEFLRNALNCYWWLEERNDGTYAFRVEHVEWFRRGGSYTGQMDAQFNLTEIKTRRNFPRNGEAAKRLDDQLHKYSYDMNGMAEKYLFSWQGDGGSDAFKGNPMFFKAGWVEKGTSESHEVDNIFADLGWLMLNAGSDTASSKNYDGIFAFSGYRADATVQWRENSYPEEQYWVLTSGTRINAMYNIWLTIPAGATATVTIDDLSGSRDPLPTIHVGTWTGTGRPQCISLYDRSGFFQHEMTLRVNFGNYYSQVEIHRIHALTGHVYNVPNVLNRLTEDGYLQNGPLAWPWLQCEFLHYDIPAQRWGYRYDDLDDLDSHQAWETDGTVKLRKKQEVPMLPLPTKSDEEKLDKGVIGGLKDSQGQLQTGIVKSATINLGTRNATLTLMYDMIS